MNNSPDKRPTVALKVDVDTLVGSLEGIPALLDIFKQFDIHATFYFSLGPDNSGKAIRRIVKKGFLQKMLRTKAPSMYGIRTMLYGTLLPAPDIGMMAKEQIRSVAAAGHETGIHCWDHIRWHDYLSRFPLETTKGELKKAADRFRSIFTVDSRTTAAPGWTISSDSLAVQDEMGLNYSSDSRGRHPFYPRIGGKTFSTLQIPSTWPTMDELLGEGGITFDNINDHYMTLLKDGLNVHTIHAEMEGKAAKNIFIDLLERLRSKNVRFITLGEAATEFGKGAPVGDIAMGSIEGRAMPVALQL